MFPLGAVLFPSAVLPLHVFEPRYRAMAAHLLGGDVEPEFGVVLIERGNEVGGGDERFSMGTLARIVEAGELPDGRIALVAFGVSRLRIDRWLPEDPWPRALVVDEPDVGPADPTAAAERWTAMGPLVRQVLGLAVEVGEPAMPVTTELAADPALGTLQAAAAVGLGALDQQAVLATTDVDDRLDRLGSLLADRIELLEGRLRMG